MSRPRFLLDEHIPRAIAVGLRRRGIEVLRAQEAGLQAAPDDAYLALSSSEGWVIVTQDQDFLEEHSRGVLHAGIVFCQRHHTISDIVLGIELLASTADAEAMVGGLEFL